MAEARRRARAMGKVPALAALLSLRREKARRRARAMSKVRREVSTPSWKPRKGSGGVGTCNASAARSKSGRPWPSLGASRQTSSAKHCVLLSRTATWKRRRRTWTGGTGATCCAPGPRLRQATIEGGASHGSEALTSILHAHRDPSRQRDAHVWRLACRSGICFSGGIRASCGGS